jgi:PAS domain S-box-containing protein
MSSRVIETGDGTILRTVVPVHNRAACHGCHDPAHGINGVMLLDMDAGTIRAAANRDLRWLVAGTVGLALVLITAIALIVRVVVLRRLQRFETTARQICEGRLDRRVPASGSDTISWLGREFNIMADAVTGLLGDVHRERERLERVINSIDDGIVVLDEKRTVIAANDAFLARSGETRGRTMGCSCTDATERMCGGCDCPTLACLTTGQRQVRVFERQKDDGSVAWEEVHASPVAGMAGTPRQVVEVWRDITDRRAAEARLAESHRLASLGLLASGFSHELNTPLATVLTCVEGIAREVTRQPDWQRVGESAIIARDQILRCRGITQHFLRMSRGRPAAGDIVDVHAAAAAVMRLIQPTARELGITIDMDSPGADRLRVRANEADLHHALMNVLLNAVQAQAHAAGGGAVALTLRGGEAVHVQVSDRGPGIPAGHQKRIFEPFFSLREGGTGLGLFLALTFVRQWGGEITLESTPGAGATFDIVLPALALDQPAVA